MKKINFILIRMRVQILANLFTLENKWNIYQRRTFKLQKLFQKVNEQTFMFFLEFKDDTWEN